MKKIYIVLLLISLGGIIYFLSDLTKITTYENIQNALTQEDRFVHIVASLDRSKPIEYDPIKNPNNLVFYVQDSTHSNLRVIYLNTKPVDFEKAEKIVLKGKIKNGDFHCKEILLKCPSKYKDGNAVKGTMSAEYKS